MAGTIIADTLTHSTAGSIATNYVVNGSAKAWANYSGSGTTLNDSLNTSSATDHGTGQYTTSWTNSFDNATYAGSMISQGSSTGNTAYFFNMYFGGMATGSLRINSYSQAIPALQDSSNVSTIGHGDLA